MRFSRILLGVSDSVIDRVLCVIGTIVFSQFPEFMQQYLQRLGGHLDEARRHVEQFRSVANQSGITLERLITQTGANSDIAVAKLGGVMTETLERLTELQGAHDALESATLWTRPLVFLQNLDREIAHATWSVFKPAIPTTVEGLVYAATGMLVLLMFYHGAVRYPITRAANSRRRHREPRAYAS